MKTNLLYILIFLKFVSFSQNATIFNNEGKILKSFGTGNAISFMLPKNLNIKKNILVIENVNDEDGEKYYVLYQIRKNDYLYQTNLTSFSFNVTKGTLIGNSVYFDLPEIEHGKLMSYQLIKTNNWGSDTSKFNCMVRSDNWMSFYTKDLNLETNLSNYLQNKLKYLHIRTADSLIALTSEINSIKKITDKNDYLKNDTVYKRFTRTLELLNSEAPIIDKKIEKLGGLAQTNDVVNSLNESIKRLTFIKNEIIIYNYKLDSTRQIYTSKLASLNKQINKIKSNINYSKVYKDFTDENNLTVDLKTPVYSILHQGTLINNDFKIKEIIYDITSTKIYESAEENISLKRQTPDLPQLTTDDELYTKIINVTPDILKNNLITIQLNVNTDKKAAESDLENGPIIKTMDKVSDAIFSDGIYNKYYLKSGLLPSKLFIREIASIPDTSNIETSGKSLLLKNARAIIDSKGKFIIKLVDSYKIIDFLSQSDYEEFSAEDKNIINEAISIVNKIKLDTLSKINALGLNDINLGSYKKVIKFDLTMFNLNDKQQEDIDLKNIQIDRLNERFKTALDILMNDVSVAQVNEPNYFDYILKYEKELAYLSKPVVTIKGNTSNYSNYSVTMTNGTLGKPSYTIKNENFVLVENELAPVRKRYWFSVNAGVVWTPMLTYQYDKVLVDGTQNTYYIKETKLYKQKFVPTLFFSTYFRPNDIYSKYKESEKWSKWHFDIGIDYYDSNLLDNIYLGFGIEPVRGIHFVGGARLGNVSKVDDLKKVNPVNFDLEPYTVNKFNASCYFGINLGFNLIPIAIKTLLNK